MALTNPPNNYTIYNDLGTKKLAIVVDIEGLDYLTSTTIGRIIKYGDPIGYGDPGILYGGLIPFGLVEGERDQRNLLSLDGSSLTLSQRLEPEQGRASISTLSMTFIDKEQYMTRAITPGLLIPEILGTEVKIWLGYAQTSFPEDFYVVWRGRVAQVNPGMGRVTLQFTDSNIGKRQIIFYGAKSNLSSSITDVATTIPVTSNTDFHKKILGPDGTTYDSSVKTYLKIEDEYIEYQQTGQEATGFGTNQFINVLRGQQGSVAAAHPIDAEVTAHVQLQGHAIDLALKIMLSGWNGPYLTGFQPDALAVTGDISNPIVLNAIVLPANTDAVRDLGLEIGDFITVALDPTPANNGLCRVLGFQDSNGQPNKLVLVNKNFTPSILTPAFLDLRSQFDTFPVSCGLKLPGWEVDVAGHIFYKDTYLFDPANSYRFFLSSQESGKSFIETEIMLPIGAYCLTRQGKLSMGLTKPPIADERTTNLSVANVIDPKNIVVQRSLNNRKFFNEIDWEFNYDKEGEPTKLRKTLDTDSLDQIGLVSVLPIKARGARTDLGFLSVVERRERFLLSRYAQAAVLYDLKTNFGAGNLIEVGDVVILTDNGKLQIPNMATGERNLGQQLFEVNHRSIDLKTGQVSLQLIGGLGALVDDRYATISPSSLVTTGSTTTKVRITESFGEIFPGNEQNKWIDYINYKIAVHSYDYSQYAEVTLLGIDPADNHALLVDPALPFVPAVNHIVDLANYPTGTDPLDQALPKLVHAYLDPTVAVTAGISTMAFQVGVGDIAKFLVGATVLVHNASYSLLSPESKVTSVVGLTVSVDTDLTFIPSAGQSVELIGFADSGGAYRFV